eukprot:3621388-Rhodomonas_salina.1
MSMLADITGTVSSTNMAVWVLCNSTESILPYCFKGRDDGINGLYELEPGAQTLDPRPWTLNHIPETLDPTPFKPYLPGPHLYTLSPRPISPGTCLVLTALAGTRVLTTCTCYNQVVSEEYRIEIFNGQPKEAASPALLFLCLHTCQATSSPMVFYRDEIDKVPNRSPSAGT